MSQRNFWTLLYFHIALSRQINVADNTLSGTIGAVQQTPSYRSFLLHIITFINVSCHVLCIYTEKRT